MRATNFGIDSSNSAFSKGYSKTLDNKDWSFLKPFLLCLLFLLQARCARVCPKSLSLVLKGRTNGKAIKTNAQVCPKSGQQFLHSASFLVGGIANSTTHVTACFRACLLLLYFTKHHCWNLAQPWLLC